MMDPEDATQISTDPQTSGALDLLLLNDVQAQAASHVDGPMVVFAGAGSGKTRVITFRIANLLAAHRVPPYRILSVTFTNKAAGEMKRRLEKLVGADLARDLWVGTFHATCSRLLRRHAEAAGLRPGFVIYDDDDQRAVMNRIYRDLKLDDRRYPVRQTLGRIHRAKQEGLLAADYPVKDFIDDVVVRSFAAYEERLAQANAADFDDLLVRILRLVEDTSHPVARELRRRFRYVLVDEFQDVNQVQYRLVRALTAEHHNLFVVGDDDQSIYRWRGADVRIVRNFTVDHPNAIAVKLEQNYRSSANIVSAALGVIAPARGRVPKELWTENEPGTPVDVVAAATERDEAAFVAERIRELVVAGVPPTEIAVFYRTHAQSRVLEEVLRSARIAHQVVGGMRFFERTEVKDLIAYLRLVANPDSDVDLMRIINVPPRKIGETTVEKLAAFARARKSSMFSAIVPLCESGELGAQPRKALAHFRVLFDELADGAIAPVNATDPPSVGPEELAERVLDLTGYRQMLVDQDDDESEARLLNLEELLGSIGEYEAAALSAGDAPTLSGWLESVALTAAADELKDQPRVVLMTVHAAKGLEFSHVFITGMEEETFPFQSSDPTREQDIEEERRLAYVAVTRAREHLTMLHVERRTIYGRVRYCLPSRFIKDMPTTVVGHSETESKRALGGRFIDRPLYTPAAEAAGLEGEGARARLAWSQPQTIARRQARADAVELADFDEVPPNDDLGEAVLRKWSRRSEPPRQTSLALDEAAPVAGERYVELDEDVAAARGLEKRRSPQKLVPSRAELGRAGGAFSKGSRVLHATFGVGVVLSVESSADPTAMVEFSGWLPKRIKTRFLEPAP